VTARPATPDLTERDARSLHELYAHDAELLRLMTEAEALRDLAKRARDACATHFHHALIATKHEQAFGESLVAISRRMHALGAPAVPGETHERGEASRPGETLGVTETRDLPADVPKEKATNDVDRLARKLGDAFVATAVARGRAYERLLAKVEALARDVERAHRVSLESAAKAHEKAYNQLRAPTKRLERLRARDQELDDDDAVALKIDQAEVDLGKRVGIMKETTSMLKQRSAAFLAGLDTRRRERVPRAELRAARRDARGRTGVRRGVFGARRLRRVHGGGAPGVSRVPRRRAPGFDQVRRGRVFRV
jgi:hypothetical protein